MELKIKSKLRTQIHLHIHIDFYPVHILYHSHSCNPFLKLSRFCVIARIMLCSPELPFTSFSSLESIPSVFFYETFPKLSACVSYWSFFAFLKPYANLFSCRILIFTDLFPLLHFDFFKGWSYKLLISLILVFSLVPDS